MNKPFIVAELSANHLGSLERALKIIDAAAKAGADAVKFQTWSPGSMVLDKTYRLESGPWVGRLLHELYEEAETPWHWHDALYAATRSHGMVPFSSVFDTDSVDFLKTLDCPIYKISSFEITDYELIRHAARTGKPMIISTGMASLLEIQAAGAAFINEQESPKADLTLLKCTSAYPAKYADMNLDAMQDLTVMPFGYDSGTSIGLSDHTLGIAVPVAAVALGAEVIEKHLTLRRADGGPDAAFSLEPHEFAQMVTACRQAKEAIGMPGLGDVSAEGPSRALRRSLYWCTSLSAGHVLQGTQGIKTARPGLGLPPSWLGLLAGRVLKTSVEAGMPVLEDQFL